MKDDDLHLSNDAVERKAKLRSEFWDILSGKAQAIAKRRGGELVEVVDVEEAYRQLLAK